MHARTEVCCFNNLLSTYFSLHVYVHRSAGKVKGNILIVSSCVSHHSPECHFLWFSRSKINKTLAGRDATFVLYPFSLQPCVGAYVGRAHVYAHFGPLACMRSRNPSATSYFLVCRRGGSQLLFFFYSVKRHVTFSTRWLDHPQNARQFSVFFDVRCIF